MGFLVAILFWIAGFLALWAIYSPRTLGLALGKAYMKITDGGQPDKVDGLRNAILLVLAAITAILFYLTGMPLVGAPFLFLMYKVWRWAGDKSHSHKDS